MKLKFTANFPFAKLYMDIPLKFFNIEKVWGIFFYHSAVYKDLISKKTVPTNFIVLTRGLTLQVNSYFLLLSITII